MKWLKNAFINWKPALGGIVAGGTQIMNTLYPVLPLKYQLMIQGAALLWMGFTGKQKNVTGGDVKQ